MNRRWRVRRRRLQFFSFETDLKSVAGDETDEKFIAEFKVTWKAVRASCVNSAPYSVIRDYLRVRAEQITSERPVTHFNAVADRICVTLATPHDLSQSGIRILQTHIKVSVDPDVLDRARSREGTRERARQRERQLADEVRYIDAFRSKVLADPGMALAFWFMKHPDKTDANSYDNIERLSRRIASHSPENIWVQIASILQDFIGKLNEEEKRRSIEFLDAWFLRYGKEDYASRLPEIPKSSASSSTEFPPSDAMSPS
jgi:hypothetical protein